MGHRWVDFFAQYNETLCQRYDAGVVVIPGAWLAGPKAVDGS